MRRALTSDIEGHVKDFAEELAEDDQRGNHISYRRTYHEIKEDFPDYDKTTLSQSIGVVMKEADYLERWGQNAYLILEDEL